MDQILKLFLPDHPKNVQVGDPLSAAEAMKLAIAEAWKGVGRVSPNPPVGCVIVSKDGHLLAKGFHSQLGAPHAEAMALARLAGRHELERIDSEWDLSPLPMDALTGATVYVTLEPCAHLGRTPSCAETLAKLPIDGVIFGLYDPNPVVSGRGRQRLLDAGKKCRLYSQLVDVPSLERELTDVCEQFLVNQELNRPFVTLKVASSLDGVFSLRSGESQWITGERARNFAQFFRGSHDAILAGRASVLRDNPSLTIRHPHFSDLRKKVVVIDSKGVLLEKRDLKLFRMHAPENLVWVVAQEYEKQPKVPVELVRVPSQAGNLSLPAVHEELWKLGIRSIYLEAGGQTLSAHLSAHLADRLVLFQASLLLGTAKGRSWSEGFGVDRLDQAVRIEKPRRAVLGDDSLFTGRITYAD